jgi:hypothetical protein
LRIFSPQTIEPIIEPNRKHTVAPVKLWILSLY